MKDTIDRDTRELAIVTFDLETTPTQGLTWGLYNTNVLHVIEPSWILCGGYKWMHEDEVRMIDQPSISPRSYRRNRKDDRLVCQALWEILDRADLVVGQNHIRFDIKKLQARFFHHGMELPSPYHVVDTTAVAKKMLKHESNSLKFLTRQAGITQKSDPGKIDTWIGCMEGDPDAWAHMIEYCMVDVKATEELYLYLRDRGFITNHPNIANLTGKLEACPKCGHEGRMMKRGLRATKTIVYQRYKCGKCNSYSSERKTGTGPRFN